MLPFLVEGLVNMISPPADDPPDAAASLFFGCLIAMPLLVLFSMTATDEAMRHNRGSGTTYAWDGCVAPCVRRLAGPERVAYWQRHLGTDGLFIFWIFFVMMVTSLPPLVPMWLLDLDNAKELCGHSMSCGASLALTIPFTAGSGLMLRATYPENFGASYFFPEADPEDEPFAAESASSDYSSMDDRTVALLSARYGDLSREGREPSSYAV